jgi:hypothetical protein
MRSSKRRAMICKELTDLDLKRQYKLLKISRSSTCYKTAGFTKPLTLDRQLQKLY